MTTAVSGAKLPPVIVMRSPPSLLIREGLTLVICGSPKRISWATRLLAATTILPVCVIAMPCGFVNVFGWTARTTSPFFKMVFTEPEFASVSSRFPCRGAL